MFKRLSKSIREYKTASILSPIFMVLEVLMEVITPLYMAHLIDYGISANDMNVIWGYGALLVLFCILSLFFGFSSGSYAAKAAAGLSKNLREDMYYNIQNFSFSNIDKFSTSGIVTRLTTDITNIQNAYQMLIRVAVRCPVMLISAIIMAFTINVQIASIFLISMIVLALGFYLIVRVAYPMFRKIFRIYDELNNVVQENLHAVRVVKSFVREDFEEKKFANISEKIFTNFVKAEKLVALNSPLMQFIMYVCMLALAWFGAVNIINGNMEVGKLSTLLTYAMQMLMSLMMLVMVLVMISMARSSAERVYQILEEETDIKNPENPIYEVKNGDITFKNVSFSYAKDANKCCLKDINLDIKEGETIGIIGATGSSKTTLVQLIPRLYDTFSGEVLVAGKNVKQYDLKTIRDSVAMVLQKNTLFTGTIKENLRWGNENATDEELINVCKLAQADGFINEFPDKYDTYIEEGGRNVSGGQKQRLCIARALLKKPKILILDDSTSAVDTKTDALIREAFKTSIPNTTKIIIAQRISSIQHSDKIVVLNEGKIDGIGTHDTLLQNNELYKEIYDLQQKGGFTDEQ